MSIPESLASKFVVVRGRWIHVNDIAKDTVAGVTLHNGTVYQR